eukprot:Tbor_TRINITY_DN5065_c0_g1::TRINITY_DN5065_c0_g1_i1::g.14060::m.14060/K15335/NSUN2; tRNA (cytosine34-C5)-methyltransferase
MPAPKVKAAITKGHRKKQTVIDADGNWTSTNQHQNITRTLESPGFVRYYHDLQKICGDGNKVAFDNFMDMMRTPLETTIWINDTDALASQVSNFFKKFGDSICSEIPWYPYKGMGWRIHADKVGLRKDPKMQELRQFLIRQTTMGTISRQEEVSMIPPFLLNIQPTDACLDMCASPGSKTAQMLVQLGRHKMVNDSSDASLFPFDYLSDGFVMANELDTARANMLVHQVKRLRLLFPFALFSNHDARYFPEIPLQAADDTQPQRLRKFDKILCDVVCSGDGTIRKSPFIFKVWSPREAIGLQKTQIQIALRACHLLKVGGRMVYSTCSLNPIENEAVVSQIMQRTEGSMELRDSRALLPNLKCSPGLTKWVVTDSNGVVQQRGKDGAHEALFPLEDQGSMDLTKCMRLMPEHCNGGGFFIAVFDKVKEWEIPRSTMTEEERDIVIKRKRIERDVKQNKIEGTNKTLRAAECGEEAKPQQEDEKVKMNDTENSTSNIIIPDYTLPPQFVYPAPVMINAVRNFYELPDFPIENLVSRTPNGELALKVLNPTSNVTLVSNEVREVLKSKSDKLIVVSAGLRVMAFEHLSGGWRISYEAASVFYRY